MLWESSGILFGPAFAEEMLYILRIIKHEAEPGILVEPFGILGTVGILLGPAFDKEMF